MPSSPPSSTFFMHYLVTSVALFHLEWLLGDYYTSCWQALTTWPMRYPTASSSRTTTIYPRRGKVLGGRPWCGHQGQFGPTPHRLLPISCATDADAATGARLARLARLPPARGCGAFTATTRFAPAAGGQSDRFNKFVRIASGRSERRRRHDFSLDNA
jgi:hypothetical protein